MPKVLFTCPNYAHAVCVALATYGEGWFAVVQLRSNGFGDWSAYDLPASRFALRRV